MLLQFAKLQKNSLQSHNSAKNKYRGKINCHLASKTTLLLKKTNIKSIVTIMEQ